MLGEIKIMSKVLYSVLCTDRRVPGEIWDRVPEGRSENRRPPQTTAGRTADHHRTTQDAPQNTVGRGK